MQANKKILGFILAIIFCFIIIIESVSSKRVYALLVESDFTAFKVNKLLQEKARYKYLGIEKCASICHNNDEMGFHYDIVKNSSHGYAFKILSSEKAMCYAEIANVEEDPQESSVCLKCHVTGGGNNPSSFTSTYKKEDGITCEACHKGEFISKTFIPKEIDCLKCHNNSVHQMKEFDYKERLEKIAHPRLKFETDTNIYVKEPESIVFPLKDDNKIHYIGENYGGGIVFYTYDSGRHGLIAAKADQGIGIRWNNGVNRNTGSSGDGVGAGIINTSKILSAQIRDNPNGNFAAKVCEDYSVTTDDITYDDWYLPSKFELNLLYLQRNVVGGFARGYWSSTEIDSIRAWNQYFNDGFQFSYNGKDYAGYVRAIRKF